eukprot:TRINITY_DN5453_c0_g1_i19.p1 TRINITY_DN5453_c0_g1~~TRINITY_DN5453_c0_g1_i19.p1  ORF type:complete len:115 (-),score=6.41 TRINITY_DN5453_c0_g1_i19:1110-1454(-)
MNASAKYITHGIQSRRSVLLTARLTLPENSTKPQTFNASVNKRLSGIHSPVYANSTVPQLPYLQGNHSQKKFVSVKVFISGTPELYHAILIVDHNLCRLESFWKVENVNVMFPN